jgi:DNA-binding transcriptional regulator YiaG
MQPDQETAGLTIRQIRKRMLARSSVLDDKPGTKMRLMRKRMQITQRQLAKMTGYSAQSICKWESNDREVPGAVLGYLRVLLLLTPEQRAAECARVVAVPGYDAIEPDGDEQDMAA